MTKKNLKTLSLFTALIGMLLMSSCTDDATFEEALIDEWTVEGLDYPNQDEDKMKIEFKADGLLTYQLKTDGWNSLAGYYQIENDILYLSDSEALPIFELPIDIYSSRKMEFGNGVIFK